MSYRDPEQSLEKPINTMIESIDSFCNAVDARIESHDYQPAHINKIVQLSLDLRAMQIRLRQLGTW